MTEQERFEALIATRIHPANFTKVNDMPILGWNGAKTNDYVNPTIQQHWITWQAAQQKEGYVLVPVEATEMQVLAALVVIANNKGGDIQREVKEMYKLMISAAQEME